MDFTFAPSGPERPGLAVVALRGLLEISRLSRQQVPLTDVLDTTAAILGHGLGFSIVAIQLLEPDDDRYRIVAVHGSDDARRSLLGGVRSADAIAPLLDARFERSGAYFIPDGSLEYEPDIDWYRSEIPVRDPGDESEWRVEDALVVPMVGSGDRHLGLISVDDPVSGRRPDDAQLEVLAAFGAHAALLIESAGQVRELEAALSRNRAVIRSSLDGVIGLDARGCVTDFNPAAEQTFGYRSEEVIGRELLELIVPAGERDILRRRLASGLAPGGDLIGRRHEFTVMRANGELVPIEFAITRLEEGGAERPVFYAFVRDISERRRAEEELAHLAYHDSLTGLPNRAQVEQQLELALARARRNATAVAVMFIDLDDFKSVNDCLGHAVGDRFLTAVATRLRGVLRDSDVLARRGGDEFLVLLADVSDDPTAAAVRVGDKLLDALAHPIGLDGHVLHTGASIGVSVYPGDAGDSTMLLRHADAAMYRAKALGGGRVVTHDDGEPVITAVARAAAGPVSGGHDGGAGAVSC